MTKKHNKTASQQKQHRTPRAVEHVSDSDDEEIPEDEAFNSDDERKFGVFFEHDEDDDGDSEVSSSSGDDSMSDDGIASDDEDEEGDGGQYMLDLLDKLDGPNKKDNSPGEAARLASSVAESEFAASVVKNSNLTLDALMEGLQDTQGFGKMQKTMEKVVHSKAPAVPVAKSVADRASRKVHYQHETEQISRWMEAVQQNRRAETLDFRHKERLGDVTKEQLVEKFVPTTDFEKELHEALMKAGQQDEEAILKREQALQEDDLGSNTLTMEEYKKRQGQLAKMRALMFYHEQKRHHMNKIKSKKYRRIRKRQRQRQKEAEANADLEENPDLARELEEKEEVERMKERMTLAHKNTSKWAKRVLKRGKNVDVDTRRALSAQLKRGDDLRKKMNSTRGGNRSSDEEGDEDLVEMARKVLEDSGDHSTLPIKSPGLFKLSFMQKGIEAQRERAKEEARQLLRELQANEDVPDSDEDLTQEKEPRPASDTRKVASEAAMKDFMSDGNMVAKSLHFGNSSSIAVSGRVDIEIPVGDGLPDGGQPPSRQTTSQHSVTMQVDAPLGENVADTTPLDSRRDSRKVSSTPTASIATTRVSNDDEANPWMQSDFQSDDKADKGTSKKHRTQHSKKPGVIDVDGAVEALGEAGIREDVVHVGDSAQSKAQSSEKKIAMLTQEELVRRAFASAEAQDIQEEFVQEKQALEERDDPTRKKAAETKSVSGWGSWAGEGTPVLKPRRNLPKRLQPPQKKLPKRKRQDEEKPNVIINEKRQKKTANQFQIAEIPYPYTSREEYERAMAGGIGREWNVSSGVKNLTRPTIMTRPGKVIQPISKKVKQKRPAAKF